MRLRVLDWNAKVHRDPAVVAAAIEQMARQYDAPHVIVVHEAHQYRAAIKARMADDYRLYAARGWAKAASTIVLVRRSVAVERWWALRMKLSWIGPQGGLQPGRTMPVIRLERWTVVGVHKAWGLPRGRNLRSVGEEFDRLVKLASRKSMHRKPLVLVGDWNAGPRSTHPDAPRTLAARIGGRVIVPGPGVDYAIVRGCHGGGFPVQRHGSDHPAHLYRFVTRDERSFRPDAEEA